jgi:hypothetical protein
MMAITGGATITTLAVHVVNSIQGTESSADTARDDALAMADQHGFSAEEREQLKRKMDEAATQK